MRCLMTAVLALVASLISMPAIAEERDPQPALRLAGYQYLVFARSDYDGQLNPNGSYQVPMYFVFGQDGDSLYGVRVMPDIDLLYGEDGVVATGETAVLLASPLCRGSISGKKLMLTLENPKVKNAVLDELSGVLLKKGSAINLTTTLTADGSPMNLELQRCNENDRISGIYVGKYAINNAPFPSFNNCIVALHVKGTSGTVHLRFRQGASSTTWNLTGIYNAKTRSWFFEMFGLQYSISIAATGEMTVESTTNYYTGRGLLHPCGNKGAKPVLGKVKPASLSPGQSATVTYGAKNVLPGCLVTDDNAGVNITGYRLVNAKTLEVYVTAAATAAGTFLATVTNADGASAAARKKVAIK